MLWLAGASAVEILAYAPKDRPPRAAILTVQALLANDVILSITFNDNIAMGSEFAFQGSSQVTAIGDGGTLTIHDGWGSGPADSLVLEQNGQPQEVNVEGKPISPAAGFVASILDGTPVLATVEDACHVVAFNRAAYQSAAERHIVRLEDAI